MTVQNDRYRRISLLPLATVAIFGTLQVSAQPADLDPESGARLPYVTRADLGEEGKRLADIFAPEGNAGDRISGPLAFAAYNIPVANALLDLHDGAVGGGILDDDIRELAILVASRETNYTLEWNAHLGFAQNVGVDPVTIEVVLNDLPLDGLSQADATVIRFGREMLRDKRMQSSTFAKAVELFTERGAMDLVAVMSTYAVSGFFAIAVDEHPPGEMPLKPLE